jgi:NitT/TauT family transport system ATP-binding protein
VSISPSPYARTAADEALLDVRHVSKTYQGDRGDVTALAQVSLKVEKGEFVSFLGPSGCGKTTLMLIMAGLIPPTNGKVYIKEQPIDAPFTDLGIVFQNAELLDWRTAIQNVMLQIEIRKLKKREYIEVARDLLKRVGLETFGDHYPEELSGGMKQRVALCRALVHNPEILLLDEPFGALDAMTRDQMNLDLQKLWLEKRKTAILVTHSIDEAVFLSDRVIVMSARPASVVDEVRIDLPRPRHLHIRDSAEFNAYTGHLRQRFKQLGVFADD